MLRCTAAGGGAPGAQSPSQAREACGRGCCTWHGGGRGGGDGGSAAAAAAAPARPGRGKGLAGIARPVGLEGALGASGAVVQLQPMQGALAAAAANKAAGSLPVPAQCPSWLVSGCPASVMLPRQQPGGAQHTRRGGDEKGQEGRCSMAQVMGTIRGAQPGKKRRLASLAA
eukprot:1142631-Pelagomonas_calceolata.AAC.6